MPQHSTPPRPSTHAGVTVWELGAVHRGAWAPRYWSSPGCLFHHAYPPGYRATKVAFGRTYEMRIEEGPTGPLFKVRCRGRSRVPGCWLCSQRAAGLAGSTRCRVGERWLVA